MRTLVPPIFDGPLITMPGSPTPRPINNQGFEAYPWCPICLTQFHAADAVPHLRSYVHEMLERASPPKVRYKNSVALVCLYQSLGINIDFVGEP